MDSAWQQKHIGPCDVITDCVCAGRLSVACHMHVVPACGVLTRSVTGEGGCSVSLASPARSSLDKDIQCLGNAESLALQAIVGRLQELQTWRSLAAAALDLMHSAYAGDGVARPAIHHSGSFEHLHVCADGRRTIVCLLLQQGAYGYSSFAVCCPLACRERTQPGGCEQRTVKFRGRDLLLRVGLRAGRCSYIPCQAGPQLRRLVQSRGRAPARSLGR